MTVTMSTPRTDPPPLPEGLDPARWRFEPDVMRRGLVLDWALARPLQNSGRPAGERCRYGQGPGHPLCGKPAVAWMDRGHSKSRWWAYCAEHMYGAWIENGQVMRWRLVEISPEEVTAGP